MFFNLTTNEHQPLLGTFRAMLGLREVGLETDDFILVFASHEIDPFLWLGLPLPRGSRQGLTSSSWVPPRSNFERSPGSEALSMMRTFTPGLVNQSARTRPVDPAPTIRTSLRVIIRAPSPWDNPAQHRLSALAQESCRAGSERVQAAGEVPEVEQRRNNPLPLSRGRRAQ